MRFAIRAEDGPGQGPEVQLVGLGHVEEGDPFAPVEEGHGVPWAYPGFFPELEEDGNRPDLPRGEAHLVGHA